MSMLWAAHQLESYKISPLIHSLLAVKDKGSQYRSAILHFPHSGELLLLWVSKALIRDHIYL